MKLKKPNLLICFLHSIFIVLCLSQQVNGQETKIIKGKILSENGEAISGANVFVKGGSAGKQGTGFGTSTDEYGNFIIENVTEENFVLIISCIGYSTLNKTVTLNPESSVTELIIELNAADYDLSDVVVTGTRTEKKLINSPVRTEVINNAEIRKNGFLRLTDVLREQSGLAVVDNHGSGVQIQGMDPDYTLILVDGDPVVGRTAGTLELSRFDVSNLKQIEIVKGPSSSLYGSEALAGVINLISEKPSAPLHVSFKSIYGTHNTLDLSGNGQFIYGKLNGSLFINSNSSGGYDFNPGTISQTAPRYNSYSINPRLEYEFGNDFSLSLNGRIYFEDQENSAEVLENSETKLLDDKDNLRNWSGSFTLKGDLLGQLKTEAKFYITQYKTESTLTYKNDNQIYDYSIFDQYLYKGELFSSYVFNSENLISLGTGLIYENVEAQRISEGIKRTNSGYVFLQHEWIPSKIFDFVIGGRFDSHSDYSSKLSPKFSLLIKPFEDFRIRGSFGSGFKAPTLQQLYLDFTNPQVGYSVFGSSNFIESYNQLLSEGQIDRVLIDPLSVSEIKTENSVAFNLGIESSLFAAVDVSVNLFRNNVRDLIEAIPIARKKNGQSVYTYLNINKIYTQGIESLLTFKPFEAISFSISYQYLDAKDEDIIDQIKEGKISTVTSSGRIRKLSESEYGGLFNRSKHSGTVRLTYDNSELGFTANISGIIRGKYGFGDINGNGILDSEKEYVPGYTLWNAAFTKFITKNLSLQLRLENIFDKTNYDFIQSLPGFKIFAGLRLEFNRDSL